MLGGQCDWSEETGPCECLFYIPTRNWGLDSLCGQCVGHSVMWSVQQVGGRSMSYVSDGGDIDTESIR